MGIIVRKTKDFVHVETDLAIVNVEHIYFESKNVLRIDVIANKEKYFHFKKSKVQIHDGTQWVDYDRGIRVTEVTD